MTIAVATHTPREDRSQPMLRALVLIAMALPLAVATVVHSPVPFETRVEAAFLWILCLVPGLLHVSAPASRRRPIPFLPMIGLLYGLYYALGAALGTVAILLKQELLLGIVGGVFVLEALSVIIQVGSFKLTGKRVFRMAPLHHHFELIGWSEPKVITRFVIVAIIFALFSLTTLKLR